MLEVGKKYNERNLRYMRQFYEIFSDTKLYPLGTILSWSHYRELMRLKNIDVIKYYIDVCKNYNLTKRQLNEKIKNKEYERLPEDTKNKLITKEELSVSDLIPNPIIIKTKTISEFYQNML